MEQFQQEHEQQEPERHTLRLKLNREKPLETIAKAVNGALAMLEGEELQDFKNILEWATSPDSGKEYDDILAIVNAHIGGRLVDTSGTHPEYAEGDQDEARLQVPERTEKSQPERPTLLIDLSINHNAFDMIQRMHMQLGGKALEACQRAIDEANIPVENEGCDKLLSIIDAHVELIDTSNTYQQYAWQGKITDAVQWLNEQIKALPESVPCSIDGLYPNFDDPDTGPDVYLNVLWHEVAQTEQFMSEREGSERDFLGQYRNLLITTIAKFFRYGLL